MPVKLKKSIFKFFTQSEQKNKLFLSEALKICMQNCIFSWTTDTSRNKKVFHSQNKLLITKLQVLENPMRIEYFISCNWFMRDLSTIVRGSVQHKNRSVRHSVRIIFISNSSSWKYANSSDFLDTLVIYSYWSWLLASPLDGIQCLHWADEYKFFVGWPTLVCPWVGVHWIMSHE